MTSDGYIVDIDSNVINLAVFSLHSQCFGIITVTSTVIIKPLFQCLDSDPKLTDLVSWHFHCQ